MSALNKVIVFIFIFIPIFSFANTEKEFMIADVKSFE